VLHRCYSTYNLLLIANTLLITSLVCYSALRLMDHQRWHGKHARIWRGNESGSSVECPLRQRAWRQHAQGLHVVASNIALAVVELVHPPHRGLLAGVSAGGGRRRAAAAGLGAVAPLGFAACRARTTKTSGSISCARPTSPRSRRGCYCCCAPGCWFCSREGAAAAFLFLLLSKERRPPLTNDDQRRCWIAAWFDLVRIPPLRGVGSAGFGR